MKTNNKEKLMDLAVEILNNTKIQELETVEVSETEYDDGSVGVAINLTYPADKTEKAPLSTVAKIDGRTISKEIQDSMKRLYPTWDDFRNT